MTTKRIDRRSFLGRSAALTMGGVSALGIADALMPRLVGARPAPASGGLPVLAPKSAKTAESLLLDAFKVDDGSDALAAYVERVARPLLGDGTATSGNIYHLRLQNEPATTLGDGVHFAAYQLAGDNPHAEPTLGKSGGRAGWTRMGLTGYSKIADYGHPDPAGDAPESIMIVLSHPTDMGYDWLYNEWYTDNHMIDVAKSPHFRSSTRYRPVAQWAGVPFTYLCIYEIDHPYTPELHEGLIHWLRETPDDFRQEQPKTPAGDEVLTLDIWGYCQRVWSDVAD